MTKTIKLRAWVAYQHWDIVEWQAVELKKIDENISLYRITLEVTEKGKDNEIYQGIITGEKECRNPDGTFTYDGIEFLRCNNEAKDFVENEMDEYFNKLTGLKRSEV